ncbi:MAG TPA: hypothetical protein PLB18_21305, partial [Acidobacteriota bacterium]|nr:hypothetical protein [Acidobacteriota bacterium]
LWSCKKEFLYGRVCAELCPSIIALKLPKFCYQPVIFSSHFLEFKNSFRPLCHRLATLFLEMLSSDFPANSLSWQCSVKEDK